MASPMLMGASDQFWAFISQKLEMKLRKIH
jgi:hypothetical protein